MLIAYYSWSNGNTERIAEQLADATGADLARIETVTPYPDDYDETVAQGQREVNQGARPEIEDLGADVANYDVIAVGTPTWWYTMAPAVATFLDQAAPALSGKVVVPFMTNGGWPGSVIEDMENAAQAAGATCAASFEVQFDSTGGSDLVTPQGEIDLWCKRVAKLLR